MVKLNYSDIMLDDFWQLTQSANGDVPIITNIDCLIQDIKLEALTQEGELFFDVSHGWSLLDFIQMEDDDLAKIEIKERIVSKLEKRSDIDIESLKTDIEFKDDMLKIALSFKLFNDDKALSINININRVSVEVIND